MQSQVLIWKLDPDICGTEEKTVSRHIGSHAEVYMEYIVKWIYGDLNLHFGIFPE